MSHLQNAFPRTGKVYGSLGAYADVSRYKILCIQKHQSERLFLMYILCDRGFLASRRQRKTQQQHCHAVVLELKQIVLCCAPEEVVEMHRTYTANRDHCEKYDYA